jgi:hypothetical protein
MSFCHTERNRINYIKGGGCIRKRNKRCSRVSAELMVSKVSSFKRGFARLDLCKKLGMIWQRSY